MNFNPDSLSDSRVALTPLSSYQDDGNVLNVVRRACNRLGWADEARGAFARVVKEGARVVIKPNFVTHANENSFGIEPLVTHASLVRVATEEALRAGASEVIVGDAPIQSCNFEILLEATGLGAWSEELAAREPRFRGIRDFRRTVSEFVAGVRRATENAQPEDKFTLFDLGKESLLETITGDDVEFRVTCYDPRLLARTHRHGRHQYLVARDVLEADVVINLPKLKTHKKAGMTSALKNLIGINGNKEYLPHHRVGGSVSGGDCYPGKSSIKRALEYAYDRQNTSESLTEAKMWQTLGSQLDRARRLSGDEFGVEGSWSGNDTIWRTCLDLNRVLLYGRTDGTMAETVQRKTIHLVDAVIAGQGDGPLAPQPLQLGIVLAGSNAAAIDFVGARLLGYNPQRIPITREAFGQFRWPLTSFAEEDVLIEADNAKNRRADEFFASHRSPCAIIYPAGWRDSVALD
jgi:uncharacterized protein (DUF362 family)